MGRDENIAWVSRELADHALWRRTWGREGVEFNEARLVPDEAWEPGTLDLCGSSIFREQDLCGQVLGGYLLDDADMTRFQQVGGVIDECRLRGATIHDALFKKIEMRQVDARDTDFTDTRFIRVVLEEVDARGAVFDHCQFLDVDFSQCQLTGARWQGAVMELCSFDQVDLDGVRFDGLTGTLMPPNPDVDSWWTHHAEEVLRHINRSGGQVEWYAHDAAASAETPTDRPDDVWSQAMGARVKVWCRDREITWVEVKPDALRRTPEELATAFRVAANDALQVSRDAASAASDPAASRPDGAGEAPPPSDPVSPLASEDGSRRAHESVFTQLHRFATLLESTGHFVTHLFESPTPRSAPDESED